MIAYGMYLDRNDTEDGHFLLAEGDHILCQGNLNKRIESAAVDDDGNFCLEQGAEGEKAQTCLRIFRRDGTQYGSVYTSGYLTFFRLEDHGQSVLLSHDEKLVLLSVSQNRAIFSFAIPQRFYPTDGYVDSTTGEVLLEDGERGYFRFTQSGDFPDRSTWLQNAMVGSDLRKTGVNRLKECRV